MIDLTRLPADTPRARRRLGTLLRPIAAAPLVRAFDSAALRAQPAFSMNLAETLRRVEALTRSRR